MYVNCILHTHPLWEVNNYMFNLHKLHQKQFFEILIYLIQFRKLYSNFARLSVAHHASISTNIIKLKYKLISDRSDSQKKKK